MQQELISIIVPIYNVERYLKECIDSILKQSYKNLEIILVDDGSKDRSGEICDEYAQRYSYISALHKKNGGPSSARNFGIDRANGTVFAFIDSDDYIATNFVEKLYSEMVQYKAQMSCCNHIKIYEDGREIEGNPKYSKLTVLHDADLPYGIYDDFSASNKLYRRELFDNIRYPEGKLYEDARTTYRVAEKCTTVTYDPTPLYYYRQRSASIMGTFSPERYLDRVNVWNELIDAMKSKITMQQCNEMKCRKNRLVTELILSIIANRQLKNNKELLKNLSSEIESDVLNVRNNSLKELTAVKIANIIGRI